MVGSFENMENPVSEVGNVDLSVVLEEVVLNVDLRLLMCISFVGVQGRVVG